MRKKEGVEAVSRTAEEPGQTLNVDLCFVPASHEVEIKLPAVSGSSGRLIVERPKDELSEPDYPGLVFADESLDYSEPMKQFVTASQTKEKQSGQAEMGAAEVKKADLKAKKQALRREIEALVLSPVAKSVNNANRKMPPGRHSKANAECNRQSEKLT